MSCCCVPLISFLNRLVSAWLLLVTTALPLLAGYFIIAGLVFTTVSEPYLLSEYGSNYMTDAPVKLLERMYHGTPQ